MSRAAVDPRFGRLLDGATVVHYALTVPVPRVGLPSIVTLQDVQHLDLPQMFSRAERAYRVIAYDRSSRNADRLIVTTEFVKRRVIDRLGVEPERIRVAPLGLDHDLLRPADVQTRAIPALPGDVVAAQEPRASVRGIRAAAARAAGAATGPHGRRQL